MQDILSILKFTKPFKSTVVTILFMIVIIALAKQINPWITKNVSDLVQATIEKKITVSEATDKITPLMFIALIVAWVNWISNRISWHKSAILREKLKNYLRIKAFQHLLIQDIGYFDGQTSGSIMSKVDRGLNRITGQITEITGFFLPNILSAIIAIILIVQIKWEFVVVLLLGFIPFVIINAIALKKYEPLEKKWNKLYDDEYGHFWEVISSIRLVKSFNRISYEIDRMRRFNDKVEDINKKSERVWDFSSIKDLILDTWVWGLILYLVMSAVNGSITIGTFFLLFQYTFILREPLWNLTWMYFEFRKMAIGAKSYMRIINRKSKVISKPSATLLNDVKGEIRFDKVSFEYKKDKKVINNMSFRINPGETIALVAKSGGGKTTIANLITRFYDATSGRISIDGIDVKDFDLNNLHEHIGLVLQDAYLYDDSIKMNLLYGKPKATDKEMIEACEKANAWEFIKEFKNGLNTKIGERGIQLSGGQKQRLSIARTILKNPSILMLDEATSALDSESEFKVQQAIWNLIQNRTTIIIAHRLSTIQKADRIFVLEKGKIKESGSHKELLKIEEGIYSTLYSMQTGKTKSKLLEEYEISI